MPGRPNWNTRPLLNPPEVPANLLESAEFTMVVKSPDGNRHSPVKHRLGGLTELTTAL